jgi:hypothetical protein
MFVKDPQAILDYTVDWTDWLKGDTISTSSWTVSPGITVGDGTNGAAAPSKTDTKTTIWFISGTLGVDYLATNRIVTVAGRTEDRTITVTVRDK